MTKDKGTKGRRRKNITTGQKNKRTKAQNDKRTKKDKRTIGQEDKRTKGHKRHKRTKGAFVIAIL